MRYALAALVIGVAAVALGARACSANEPHYVDFASGRYSITTRAEREAECFDFEDASGHVAFTECGSLDTLCDDPTSARFDADGDGFDDIYFETCSGKLLVSEHAGKIDERRVDALEWWPREVLDHGLDLFAVGAIYIALACVLALIVGLRRCRSPRAPHEPHRASL
jgi:hypothetical protein